MRHSDRLQHRLRGRPPRWNIASLSAPFVGFLGGYLAAMSAPHFRWVEWGFRAWLGFAAGGTLCGVVALIRRERRWGVSAAGLVLNAALAALLVYAIRHE